MQNCTMKIKGDVLTITVDLSKRLGASKSGKTEVIASSRGNAKVPGRENVCMGLNVFAYPDPA